MKRSMTIFILCFWGALGSAVEPNELLNDPILETRARFISQALRCTQCRNESIDESNADIAKDLRLLVRRRLVAGDSDTEVVNYVVARYGEYVLLKPNIIGINLVLWLSGPFILLLTLFGLILLSRKVENCSIAKLTDQEEKKIKDLLLR
ncbi:MAG: cytochrome c-type biogenesis protein [Pseudomonadales bacterium]